MSVASYSPLTAEERKKMLGAIGLADERALFNDIPEALRVQKVDIPDGVGEMAALKQMEKMAEKNTVFRHIYRGAGAYNHYIPAIVKAVTAKEELVTAYTPYQPEISQGTLQALFEYQTMVCELTGMDVSNASVYDGATAAAEAANLCREKAKVKTLIVATANPMVVETMRTYLTGAGQPFEIVPAANGRVDECALKAMLNGETASFYFESPNYYGLIEEGEKLCAIAHEVGAKAVMGMNPIACAILKTPGECGADVAVGEGQPLGMPLGFGGPYMGFMAAKAGLLRKLPGRIVGETMDSEGRRAFVLTLQAREQHIRREKASSNICTNQTLCAVTAAAYLSAMGPAGLAEVALVCHDKAAYLREGICSVKGFAPMHDGPFFHEFATTYSGDVDALLMRLEARGILGGLPIENGILWCATELCSRDDMDELIAILREVSA